MKQVQRGFTLIELVMVIVILGILAAVALPKFVDLSGKATEAAKAGVSGGVKSAHAVLTASRAANGTTPVNPTVTELAAGLVPPGTAVTTGVTSNGYTVPTYADDACATATASTSSIVLCVKDAT